MLKVSKAVTGLVGRRGSSGAHQNRVGWVLAAGGRRVVYVVVVVVVVVVVGKQVCGV